MGTYATTTSLQTLMIGTTFNTATTSLATLLITRAENEVNKYISKRYDVSSFMATSSAVPPLLTSLTETIAEGYMAMNMSRGGKEAMARGKELIKMATENLELIRDYKADLVDSSGDIITDMSNTAYRIMSSTDTYTETFAEDDPINWAIDSDKLSDIEDNRD